MKKSDKLATVDISSHNRHFLAWREATLAQNSRKINSRVSQVESLLSFKRCQQKGGAGTAVKLASVQYSLVQLGLGGVLWVSIKAALTVVRIETQQARPRPAGLLQPGELCDYKGNLANIRHIPQQTLISTVIVYSKYSQIIIKRNVSCITKLLLSPHNVLY